jgi:BASS family bile acid:Na+ symporter
MNIARLIGLAINVSMALMVLSVALSAAGARPREAFRNPGLLVRALAAMFVVMPVIAVLIARNSGLNRALLVALLLLALSPVPPVLPSKQIKAGGGAAFVLGLFVVSAVAAILIVPAGVTLIGRLFDRNLEVPFSVTGAIVGPSVLLPVVAGLLIARFAPALAGRVARPISTFAGILLLAAFVPVLWTAWPAVVAQMTNFTLIAVVGFVAVGLLTGQLLGGPDPQTRTALALATATRHPGVALAVLGVVEPANREVMPVILLYLLVGMIASAPYIAWRKSLDARPEKG